MMLGDVLKKRKDKIIWGMFNNLDAEIKLIITPEQYKVVRSIMLDGVNELFRDMSLAIAAKGDVYIQAHLAEQNLPPNIDPEAYPLNKLEEKLDKDRH